MAKKKTDVTADTAAIYVRVPHELLARIDHLVAEHGAGASRSETIVRLLRIAAGRRQEAASSDPAFGEGDRVRHNRFGNGTVTGAGVISVSYPIRFDDENAEAPLRIGERGLKSIEQR